MISPSRKVLIVDDDSSDIFFLNRMLHKCGVEDVESVESAYDASKYLVGLLPFARRCLPNLIFVDLNMGGMSGLRFISSLKNNPLYKDIPLVALSGSSDPKDKENAMKSGANAFYEKTVETRDLKDTVEGALTLDERCLVLQS